MREYKPDSLFCKRFNEAIRLRNVKQIELAEKTGIPKRSISQYTRGYAEPKSDRISLLAKALDVNPVWLCGFDVPMEMEKQLNHADIVAKVSNDKELLEILAVYVDLPDNKKENIRNILKLTIGI